MGSKAPYDGVIMPKDHFDYLMARDLEAAQLNSYVLNPENKLTDPEPKWSIFITFFALGVASGLVFGK